MKNFPGLLCLGLVLIQLVACRAPLDKRTLQYLNTDGFGRRYTGNAEEENYVTLGDGITFIDAYHPELRATARVEIDGTVMLPEIGAVHVAGMTRSEIEALLTQKYSPYFERTDITVELSTAGNKQYWILGEVAQEGPKGFRGDLTVFEAVMAARPADHSANMGRVRIIRADPRDPNVMTLNLADMIRTGDSTFNVLVQENDIIVIPPTMLAQFGNFIIDLIFPVLQVLDAITSSLSRVIRFERVLSGQGGRNNRGAAFF